NLGSGNILDAAGNAMLANVRLTAGTHTLNAAYADAADILFRSSNTTSSGFFIFVVDRAQTTTALVSSAPGTSGVGQQVTYTATVTPQISGTAMVGTVTFTDNGVAIGAPVNVSASGVAVGNVTYNVGGTHTIQAIYNPSSNFLDSQSDPLTQTVLNPSQVNVSPVSNTYGQDLVYNLTVTSPQLGTPAGTVTVTEGGIVVTHTGGDLSAGATTITIPSGALNVGSHTLVFAYTDTSATPTYASSSKT